MRIPAAVALAITFPILLSAQARSGAWTLNAEAGEWRLPAGSYSVQRFSQLKRITTANVAELRPVWSFSTGTLRGAEGSPLIVGSTMYVNSSFPDVVYALNLSKPGAPLLWKYVRPSPPDAIAIACCEAADRSMAYSPSGRIYIQGLQGDVIALDARTGREMWKSGAPAAGAGRTAWAGGPTGPLYLKSHGGTQVVIAGLSGAESGQRGLVSAFDANSGAVLWSSKNVEPEGKADIAGRYAYDPEIDLLYYSVRAQQAGLTTTFARDPGTGDVRWTYQQRTPAGGDSPEAGGNVLFERAGRKLLAHFGANGLEYTLERATGEVLWRSTAVGGCSAGGLKGGQNPAFSPVTGLFYLGVSAGAACAGPESRAAGGGGARFVALDPVQGKLVWEIKERLGVNGGALATAGGVVFYSSFEGWLKGVDAGTGKVLWSYKTPSAIVGAPVTYSGPDGQQYLSIVSGIGGWAGIGAAGGVGAEDPTAGVGALGAFGDAGHLTGSGGVLTVFALKPGTVVAVAERDTMPAFPLVPPTPTWLYPLPAGLVVRDSAETLGIAFDRLVGALRRADMATWSSFSYGDAGFAVVSRVESIRDNGRPSENRWSMEPPPPRTLVEWLMSLFRARPGRYRVLVFIVTNRAVVQTRGAVSEPEMTAYLTSGADNLPHELRLKRLGPDGRSLALVYEFLSKSEMEKASLVSLSPISAVDHLVGAGLWEAKALK